MPIYFINLCYNPKRFFYESDKPKKLPAGVQCNIHAAEQMNQGNNKFQIKARSVYFHSSLLMKQALQTTEQTFNRYTVSLILPI
jgi:hypothetical protein